MISIALFIDLHLLNKLKKAKGLSRIRQKAESSKLIGFNCQLSWEN